jgi:Mycobacterium membrane protein
MSEEPCSVDVHPDGHQHRGCDFMSMAAGFDALCDDQVDTGGGVPQHRDGFRPRHGLLVSLVRALSSGARGSVGERVKGMRIVRVLRRVWIPLVVLVVIGCGGFIVSRVHGNFGTEKRPSYAAGQVHDTKSLNPKQVVYEVFGPAGTVADISYFDVNSQPQQVDGASLPWSLKITTASPSVVGSIVAQGDSDSIGCRIVVNGEIKAERISNEVNAFTHCLVKGA